MASRRLLGLSLLLLLTPSSSLALDNNFNFYPKNAQPCLYESATTAKCDGGSTGSVAKLNTCLCGNNNDFIINTAKCLGTKDPADVDGVYSTMSDACDTSNTPIARDIYSDIYQDIIHSDSNVHERLLLL
ncbi:hypothetical protein G7046_g9191 [Stylonectria norvegica]|nr:hypothetical protein G7046_g9191 [Stylonectria norvegica]